jgi:hypothetical protein
MKSYLHITVFYIVQAYTYLTLVLKGISYVDKCSIVKRFLEKEHLHLTDCAKGIYVISQSAIPCPYKKVFKLLSVTTSLIKATHSKMKKGVLNISIS